MNASSQGWTVWWNPSKTMTTYQKLEEACAHFQEKFGLQPEIALTNKTDAVELAKSLALPVEIGVRKEVAPSHFYIGMKTKENLRWAEDHVGLDVQSVTIVPTKATTKPARKSLVTTR